MTNRDRLGWVPRRSSEAAVADVGSTALLFHARRRELHELNNAARSLWDEIDDCTPISMIANRLAERFGEDVDVVSADIIAAIDRFEITGALGGDRDVEPPPLVPVPEGAACFAAVDATFALAAGRSDVLSKAMRLLEPLRIETRSLVDVVLEADETLDADTSLARLLSEINLVAAKGSPASVRFHAGGVVLAGRAVMLPAASGSGKSTLTCALVNRGAGYLSDEMIGVGAGRRVLPYPKAITLDVAAAGLFPELTTICAAGEEHALVPASSGAALIDLVVSPRYEPHCGAAVIERLDPRRALDVLLENSMDFASTGGRGFEIIANLCEAVPVYRIVYDSLDDACALIEELASAR